MATVAREFSLDYYLLDRLKFSGLDKENLADLVSIVVSLKNKYGIVPYAIAPHGDPVPNAIAASHLIESITLNKLIKRAPGYAAPRKRHRCPARHPPLAAL
jgi:hypothetical protein